jgi:hypothetical protein
MIKNWQFYVEMCTKGYFEKHFKKKNMEGLEEMSVLKELDLSQ